LFRARWFRKLHAGTGLRRSNCSHGAARRGGLLEWTPPPRCRSSCLRSWNRHCRKAQLAGDSASGHARWIGPREIIEVEIEGVSVRVGHGADAETVAVVIRALKACT
jgi:hypothetical protein